MKDYSETFKKVLFLCVVKKSDIDKSALWYEKVNNPYINAEICVYENESSYLYEYEKYVYSERLKEHDIIKMEYYQIIDKDYLEQNKNKPLILDALYNEKSHLYKYNFDLFYEYIKKCMDEKKYGKAINEIHIFINRTSLHHVSKTQYSLIYNKLAKCEQHCEYNEYHIIETYRTSYKYDNNHLVPLYELLIKYRLAGLYEKAIDLLKHFFKTYGIPLLFNDSKLYEEFIEKDVKTNKYYAESLYTYLYYLEFEAIICYIHEAEKLIKNEEEKEKGVNYFRIAYGLCNRIMGRKMIIADEAIKQINHFRSRCINYIKDEYIFYNQEKVEELYEKSQLLKENDELKDKNHVIFTVTTCKRFDLFEKTINSLINCTKDIDLIDEWLCVDDNSSEEDRALMKEKYPFFTYIFKTPEEKGHAKSMNIIRDYVIKSGYKYTLHMEDDWQAVFEMDYIKPCIQIIENNNEGIKQVVQNRQYVQLIRPRDIDIKGGFQRYLNNGYRYILHEFYPKGSEEESQFWKRINGGYSASYWPHYSLNPSVMDSEIYKCLGPYNENVRHFEMDYASRFTNAGFRTAFFDNITRLHIGKLIGEEGKKNAYELNELVQFAQGA